MHKRLNSGSDVRAKFNDERKSVAVTIERPEIKAAAHYWRERIANARIESAFDFMSLDTLARARVENDVSMCETAVRTPFTEEELDRFECAVAYRLAQALVYTPNTNWLFHERGVDISVYVEWAAQEAGTASKLVYSGSYTRMRILPGKEVAYEMPPYLSHNWTTIWSASEQANEG
jgi:hypothetical protein